MANINNKAVIIGRLKDGAFETTGRSESWSEQMTASASIVGKAEELFGLVKPGDSMADHAEWFDGKWNGNYFVRTVECNSPDGVTAEMRLTLLNCVDGKQKPYNITWAIEMQEVQMKLINHPRIYKDGDVGILNKWLATNQEYRVKGSGGQMKFYYSVNGRASASGLPDLSEVEGEINIGFCRAVTMGIESYVKFLPVVTKTSSYLELPGVVYNSAHVPVSGTISFSGPSALGSFGMPDIIPEGYNDTSKGLWFVSGDTYTIQPDGTAQRVQRWTYTDDVRFRWIYDK